MTVIREMTWDDLEAVVAIENENFTTPWTETGFLSFMMRQDVLMLVAEEGEKILGYMGSMYVLDEADITNVSVSKNARRQGTGRALVREMICRLEALGVTTIHLEVRESNAPAIALYEKLGFEADGLRKNYYEQPTENALLMSRRP